MNKKNDTHVFVSFLFFSLSFFFFFLFFFFYFMDPQQRAYSVVFALDRLYYPLDVLFYTCYTYFLYVYFVQGTFFIWFLRRFDTARTNSKKNLKINMFQFKTLTPRTRKKMQINKARKFFGTQDVPVLISPPMVPPLPSKCIKKRPTTKPTVPPLPSKYARRSKTIFSTLRVVCPKPKATSMRTYHPYTPGCVPPKTPPPPTPTPRGHWLCIRR